MRGVLHNNRNAARLLASAAVFGLIWGCQQPQAGTGVVAPTKPLTEAQTNLLASIEKLPQEKRSSFVQEHLEEVMKHSADNKAFGDKINALLGMGSKQ